ncbi:acyltransferase [Levilactobacillus andaensis]|uniref:acyltransferase n=1 Tax=Levilactobacillus andaensis TaxID=2799570 RepID=UPI0019434971|nr:acyltransferase [Levilactobacillus andaensis]
MDISDKKSLKRDYRVYGVDIARILSMLMVVFLHNLLAGGILRENDTSFSNLTYWLVENVMIVAVNIFAMISGYLLVDRKIRPAKLLELWKVVFFWSAIPTVVLMLSLKEIDIVGLVKSFFPILTNQYWYFNAYVVLFILAPFLNAGIRVLSVQYLQKIVLSLLILSASAGFLGNLFLEGGYSALWLIIMYLTGGMIKKSRFSRKVVPNKWLILTCLLCVFTSLVGEYVSIKYLGQPSEWIKYTSPIVIIQSISLFILFTRIKVSHVRTKKILKKISPLTFAVYLVDSNPFFFHKILHSSLSFLNQLNIWLGLGCLLTLSLGMFLIVILLESGRSWLFTRIRNNKQLDWENKL